MAKKKYITYSELINIEEELHELKVVKRAEVAERIKKAREQGDLSENAEYDAAKDEQRAIEKRIEEIEKLLINAEVVLDESEIEKPRKTSKKTRKETPSSNMSQEEAQRLMEWVVNQGMSKEKAKEALAYTIGVKME